MPDVINTPDTWSTPPDVNGTIVGDNGWTSAWRHVFMSGTPDNDVVVQAIRDASFLYFSIDAKRLSTTWSTNDVVQILLDPNSGTQHRIDIQPVGAGGAATATILYRTRAGTSGAWSAGGALAGAVAVSKTVAGASEYSWSLEVKIPRGAPINIPAAADFGLYINTLLTYGAGTGPTGPANEYIWPNKTPALLLEGDLNNSPATASWGTATVSGSSTCNGVYILPSDISTSNNNSLQINLTGENTFRAVAHNAMTNGNGVAIDAKNVFATFKIANFGLSSIWANVPWTGAKSNPTPVATITAGGTHTFETTWTLNATQQATYDTDNTRHQCILVELDATNAAAGSTVVFSNKSAWTNMDFGPASTFVHNAVINARGFARPEGRRTQIFELYTKTFAGAQLEREYPQVREILTDRIIGAMGPGDVTVRAAPQTGPRVVTRFMQIVHGCLRSGRYVQINNGKYEICTSAGAYGFLVGHVGTYPAAFKQAMTAAGGQALTAAPEIKNAMQLQVPVEGMVALEHRIEATDSVGGGGSTDTNPTPPKNCSLKGSSFGMIGGLALLGLVVPRRRRDDDESGRTGPDRSDT